MVIMDQVIKHIELVKGYIWYMYINMTVKCQMIH